MAIVIQIQLDERGNIQGIERLNKTLRDTGKASKETTREMSGLDSAIDRTAKKYLTFAVAYQTMRQSVGLAKNLGIEFTNTAMQFESMKVTLDSLTKGQGAEWFGKLNAWALKMPVTTQGAVQGFIRLRAMGLQPTIEQMTILTDATAALGGHSDTFDGLVLAMGQIYSKGQLMSQELRQLAERGIPAYEILQQKLGLTAKALETTNHEAIRADVALKALFEGMAERYGGLSTKIMYETGTGIKEQLIGNWTEFKRVMMDAGPYEFVKQQMQEIANTVERDTTLMKFNYIKGARGQQVGKELFGEDKDFMRLISDQRSGYALNDAAMIANRTKYYNQIAIIYEKLREQESGIQTTLPNLSNVGAIKTINELKLSLPKPPVAVEQEEEKKAKVSYKYQEEELKRWTEREKRLAGVTTQSQEQRLNSSRAYLEKVLTETGYYADRKIEVDQAYFNELRELQQKGNEMRISLQYEGAEREIELIKANYDAKIIQYEEGDARIAELRKNMAMEIEMVEADGLKRTQSAITSFAMTWGNMWAQAAQQSGSAIDNIIGDLKRLATRLAAQSIIAEAVGAFMGMPFGSSTLSMFKNMLPLGAGKEAGGYTGNQMGFYHPNEYVSNQRTVDYYGVGFFDMLAKSAGKGGGTQNTSYVVNNNFSAAQKSAMANESDEALARRISRLIDERKIRIPA